MKISVIMTSYNYAHYIEEAINSVINQAYSNWELIIVDDGSCDNSVEIITAFCEKDKRIKFFTHENNQNKGLQETILLGLKNATGDWIAFLESDDIFEPDNLQKKVEITKQYPEVNLIFNKVNFLAEKTELKRKKVIEKTQIKQDQMNFPRNMFYDFYIDNVILTFSCVMVKTSDLRKVDFNTPNDARLDWWLWINLAFENEFYYIKEKLTTWRMHSESYIKKGKKPILYTVQVKAYKNIYSKKPSKKLSSFIFKSNIKLFFVRVFRLFKRKFFNPIYHIINYFIKKWSDFSGNKK